MGSVSDLPPESVREVAIGENLYAICHAGGKITALSGVCLHRGGPLGQGQVRDGYVICPWHAWGFHCETGENDYDSSKKVTTYPVKVEGGDILLQLP
ncbi:MAG TPA: Rieske (2Fe-2S) protein [Bryobacteraceae bacterium]|nr:Rieske (2Fe-2S) protein [Bryobacteraceae bacterium]